MNGERWVPICTLNTSEKTITLRHRTKVAEVFTCVALEDTDVAPDQVPDKRFCMNNQTGTYGKASSQDSLRSIFDSLLCDLGLEDLDIDSCEVSDYWKSKLLQLVQRYENIFTRN